jgi:hypothetical protein
MSVINNVVFNYVKIKTPEPKYKKEKDCPINDRQYSIDVCLPAATAKALKKKYKAVKSVKNITTFDKEDYEKRYKVDAPDAAIYANSEDEYSTMKLTAFAGYSDGSPVPEDKIPRVVGTKTATTTDDGKKVGRDIEVGNGSTGRVSFVERQWKHKDDNGLSLDLTGIQVATLVEYTSPSTANENEFAFEGEDKVDQGGFDYTEETPPAGDVATPLDIEEW